MAGADRMTIQEVVQQVLVREHGDVLRAALEAVCRALMEGEVSELIGAELGERRPEDGMMHRNGYRAREWQTRAGTVELQIPKIHQGSYFPSFLEPRRRSEQALLAVVQQAYVCGSRPGASITWARASGCGSAAARSAASVRRWMSTSTRSAHARWRAATRTCSSTRRSRRSAPAGVWSTKALVIAHGVHESGRREILSIDVGEAETEAFWTSFLRDLVKRGLIGVQLAICDAHAGLKAAIAKVLGCAWQHCAVHFSGTASGTHARTSTACSAR
jgi:putative transposase